MLDQKDLQAIAELMDNQTHKMSELMDAKIRESESRMVAYFESAIDPKFNLLADGLKVIRETMTPRDKITELEEEVTLLKAVIINLRRDVNELKNSR